MNCSRFVPESFKVTPELYEWATTTFSITKAEVDRQTELLRDHEFRRPYSDWNRVFRNWMRKCEEIQTFKRERQYATPQDMTKQERVEAQRSFDAMMVKLQRA